jgi:hypothetical protein
MPRYPGKPVVESLCKYDKRDTPVIENAGYSARVDFFVYGIERLLRLTNGILDDGDVYRLVFGHHIPLVTKNHQAYPAVSARRHGIQTAFA